MKSNVKRKVQGSVARRNIAGCHELAYIYPKHRILPRLAGEKSTYEEHRTGESAAGFDNLEFVPGIRFPGNVVKVVDES